MNSNFAHRRARRSLCLGLVASGFMSRNAWSQAPATLEIGVLPNINARVLMGQYQPMREYLARTQQRPVLVSTAPNWNSFHERTLGLEYDVVVTAAHLARLAQVERGYIPVLSYAPYIKALLATAKARPLKNIQDLRGQTLVLSNSQSLVTLRGMQWLTENGLQLNRDYRTIRVPTDDSVGSVVVRGDAIAALLSGGEFRATPDAVKAQFEVMTVFAEVPGFIVMANPRMPATAVQSLKEQLLAFAHGADEGKVFFGNTGFTGMVEPAAGLMSSMDVHLDATRKALSVTG